MKKKDSNKMLFKSTSEINSEEFSKIVKYFKSDFDNLSKYYFIPHIIGIVVYSLLLIIIWKYYLFGIITFVLYLLVVFIYYKLNYIKIYTSIFNKYYKGDKKFDIEYYDDCIKFHNKTLNYKDIIRSVETDSDFFLRYKNNLDKYEIINIKKNDLELEEISLFRDKIKDSLENHLGEVEEPIVLTQHDLKGETLKTHRLLMIVFILTVICMFIPNIVLLNIDLTNPGVYFSIKYVFIVPMIIPLLSLVLGIIYYRKGYKTLKNIIAGICVIIYLIISMNNAYIDNKEYKNYKDYSVIDEYKNILDVNLPNEGTVFDSDLLNEFEAFYFITYKKDDSLTLNKNIIENDKWIKIENDKTSFEKLIVKSEANSLISLPGINYLMIYNMTTNEYNKLPSVDGEYEIVCSSFNESNGILQIQKYKINYSK